MLGLHGMTDTSLMHLISWGDHLKIGDPNIDAQHVAIFSIALEVADTWHKHGHLDELKALARKLAHVLQAHFLYEEAQLEVALDPKLGSTSTSTR
jgi:hemerythrin